MQFLNTGIRRKKSLGILSYVFLFFIFFIFPLGGVVTTYRQPGEERQDSTHTTIAPRASCYDNWEALSFSFPSIFFAGESMLSLSFFFFSLLSIPRGSRRHSFATASLSYIGNETGSSGFMGGQPQSGSGKLLRTLWIVAISPKCGLTV